MQKNLTHYCSTARNKTPCSSPASSSDLPACPLAATTGNFDTESVNTHQNTLSVNLKNDTSKGHGDHDGVLSSTSSSESDAIIKQNSNSDRLPQIALLPLLLLLLLPPYFFQCCRDRAPLIF
jgi:hypothetical protein